MGVNNLNGVNKMKLNVIRQDKWLFNTLFRQTKANAPAFLHV